MRRLRAFLLLALVAGSMLVSSGRAGASSGLAPRPWRSVAAPAAVLTLSNYVMQLPGDAPNPDEGGQVDSTGVERPVREPEVPPQSQPQPQGGNQPSFSVQDTSTRANSRRDSLFSVPGAAPVETIGPSIILPAPSAATPSRTPAVKARRGILGIHPLAILAGLIALDILVVTVVGK